MLHALEATSILLTAAVMAMGLAHALELPGKMRLPRAAYLATQTIYYPGFSLAGITEPLAVIAVLALLLFTPAERPAFGLIVGALVALILLHAIFWFWVQPINRVWLGQMKLRGTSAVFFGTDKEDGADDHRDGDWRRLRDRWEYGHLARAGLGVASLVLLVLSVTGADGK